MSSTSLNYLSKGPGKCLVLTFPWNAIADAGLIDWPDAQQVQAQRVQFEKALPEIAWFQKKLAQIGYATPQSSSLDHETRNVLAVFQMRYRPSIYDGLPDAETAAILAVLTRTAPAIQ